MGTGGVFGQNLRVPDYPISPKPQDMGTLSSPFPFLPRLAPFSSVLHPRQAVAIWDLKEEGQAAAAGTWGLLRMRACPFSCPRDSRELVWDWPGPERSACTDRCTGLSPRCQGPRDSLERAAGLRVLVGPGEWGHGRAWLVCPGQGPSLDG